MRKNIVLIALWSLLLGAAWADPEISLSKHLSSTVATGKFPTSITVDPTGKYAYVANADSHDISVFSINSDTGGLAFQSSVDMKEAEDPQFVTTDRKGKFMYVTSWVDFSFISVFRINPDTGSLIATEVIETKHMPFSVAMHPSGKFAYLVHYFGISIYSINPVTGRLTLRKNVKVPGERPFSICVDPDGKYVYVTSGNGPTPTNGSGIVSVFAVNPVTGLLTAKSSVSAGVNPKQIIVHPTGKFVYVANEGSRTVSMFAVNPATGALTAIGDAEAKGRRSVLAVHPNGKFVYVPEGSNVVGTQVYGTNAVSTFAVNQATGELSAKGDVDAGDEVLAGETPSSVAVHPNGKFLYVTNSKSNNVSIYIINQDTGALTVPRE